ncbi:hypothetical protein LJC34_07175 [Oscillospiraceae bacterium OttesenSCG-928-G22]|nr:hypothetical protein [Oscillospiraceae bacterium OttesenSCG-928-G22]
MTPRNRLTEEPMGIIQQALMCPIELLDWLAVSAVRLYYLGVRGDSDEPEVFIKAMPLIAAVWSLEDGEVEAALDTVARQREAALLSDRDESAEFVLQVDAEKMEHNPSGKEIISVLLTLTDTMVWLAEQDDRQAIAKLIYYLKDFWAVGEMS